MDEKDIKIFIITFLVPGYTVSWIYLKKKDIKMGSQFNSLWEEFYNTEDDSFRNQRFKILPDIPNGNWIVKKAVGKKPAIIAKAVNIKWNRGSNYLEAEYDVSTSYLGKKIFNIVKHYAKKITIDLAFIIQGNSEQELPERVLCATRLHSINLNNIS